MIGLKVVNPNEELLLITTEGIVIRTNVSSIRVTGRNAQGVMVIKTSGDDKVASLATIEHKEPEPIGLELEGQDFDAEN